LREKLKEKQNLVVKNQPVEVPQDIFLYHEYGSHCAVLGVPQGYQSAFWKANKWKYDHFKKGRCPAKYNYINKRVSDIEGFKDVFMVERGIHKPTRSFRDVTARGSPWLYSCPADPCGCCPKSGAKCPCLCGGGWCKRCCK
jgi:hypothetical protein